MVAFFYGRCSSLCTNCLQMFIYLFFISVWKAWPNIYAHSQNIKEISICALLYKISVLPWLQKSCRSIRKNIWKSSVKIPDVQVHVLPGYYDRRRLPVTVRNLAPRFTRNKMAEIQLDTPENIFNNFVVLPCFSTPGWMKKASVGFCVRWGVSLR